MKSTKTKKLLGGVAIAAVSLGCLGLAGIANAETEPVRGDNVTQTTFDNALPEGALNGTTTVTFNISAAQTKGEDSISQHNLKYVQIGAYIGHNTSFSVESMPAMKDMLTSFIKATSGGLDSVFSSASSSYANSNNEDPLTWMLTGNSNGSFLGADPTGQASTKEDQAVRALANYLFSTVPSTDLSTINFAKIGTNSTNGYSYGTWDAANPGIYLVVDTATNNVSMPMIVSTMPGGNYTIPSSMKNIVTNTVGLKNQDPSMTPYKNYVSGGMVSSATAANGYSTTIGPNNPVEYQVSNVFPNVQNYPSAVTTYTYSFNDYPEKGMTVEPSTLQVAGIPISTLMGEGATVTLKGQFGATQSDASSATTTTKSYTGTETLPAVLLGGSNVEMQVSLDVQALQEIQKSGKATTNTAGDKINNTSFTQYTVSNPTGDGTSSTFGTDGNTMAGQAGQASSSSSKTDSMAGQAGQASSSSSKTDSMAGQAGQASSSSSKTDSMAMVQTADAGTASSTPLTGQKSWTGQTTPKSQLFGMTYDAYLNSSVSQTMNGQTTGGTLKAGNTATTTSGGVTSSPTSSTPLTTNGGYNGSSTTTPNSTTNPSNGTAGTNTPSSVNPGNITHTDGNHNPTSQSTGAGINWMKIWASGSVATGAKFTVQQWTPTTLNDGVSTNPANGTAGDWLAASASQGWSWVKSMSMADQFASVSGLEPSNPAYGGLFEISGLASGYYLVSENTTATGAAASVKPQFIVYLNPQGEESITPYGTYKDLVNNTPNGSPFFSGMKGEMAGYNTVENVKNISDLPLTGGAGILTGVIAAVLLFGTAGIVLVVYKRRKQQED